MSCASFPISAIRTSSGAWRHLPPPFHPTFALTIQRERAFLPNVPLFHSSEFYRKLLSKRLLLQVSESIDFEKDMIGRLKLRCGAQYTSKLEGMINDMLQAADHQNEFDEFQVRAFFSLFLLPPHPTSFYFL